MQKTVAILALTLLSVTAAFAGLTRRWEQSAYEDLEKGTAKGIAIRSQGGLELAPAFASLFTSPSTYIWAIADDGHGNVYAASGSPARVYRITPQGEATIVFQPGELQVQALVVGKDGVIYAGTSPDGKVYKIEGPRAAASASRPRRPARAAPPVPDAAGAGAEGVEAAGRSVSVDPEYKAAVFFDPGTKYIWDLALDAQERLYVATGDRGEIFRVQKNGQSEPFFKSDEAHVRVLSFDPSGNLIAGTDGSGLIYRISPAGQGFVLYSAPKKEITALAIDGKGNLYAAGVGEKRPAGIVTTTQPQSMPMATTTITVTATPGGSAATQSSQTAVAMPLPAPVALGITGGSEVYRIAADGSPRQLWSSREDVVYSLAFYQNRLVLGTGSKGRIFTVDDNGDSTDLVKASANHVASLARSSSGGLFAGTSNLGKLFLLRPAADTEGIYESDVFDARIFSQWGRAEVRGSGHFEIFARSGNVDNPDRHWSPWKKVDFGAADGKLDIPSARFVQWKAVLHPGAASPVVDSVTLNYLPKNVAPEVEDITVQAGAKFQDIPKPSVESVTINVGSQNSPPPPKFEQVAPAVRDRESIAVRWSVQDENDDDLVYALSYRGDGENEWKLLKEGIADKYYSFDAALLPDGGYVIRVLASDSPSHSPGEGLMASRSSSRFEVDTTPPQIQDLKAAPLENGLQVRFRAVDGFSAIERAEYSLDAGEWQHLDPVGGLSDSRVEEYEFRVPLPAMESVAGGRAAATGSAGEHVVVVRVYDRFDNMASAKSVVRK